MNEMMKPKTVPIGMVEDLQYKPEHKPRIVYDSKCSKWVQVKKAMPEKDFVSEYVNLKGNTGHCPFHDDQHKSFSVNVEENHRYCFAGCGAGSIIDFYMLMEYVDFRTAVDELADKLFGG